VVKNLREQFAHPHDNGLTDALRTEPTS